MLPLPRPAPRDPPSAAPPLPAAASLPAPPPDVTSPAAYSLEEEKAQAERDAALREAEEKKLSVRERLGRIRSDFTALLADNAAQPEALRLPRRELEVDPGLRALMAGRAAQLEEAAARELAWDRQRAALGLAKLRAHFLERLDTERVVRPGAEAGAEAGGGTAAPSLGDTARLAHSTGAPSPVPLRSRRAGAVLSARPQRRHHLPHRSAGAPAARRAGGGARGRGGAGRSRGGGGAGWRPGRRGPQGQRERCGDGDGTGALCVRGPAAGLAA
jgi:hypothetical protein